MVWENSNDHQKQEYLKIFLEEYTKNDFYFLFGISKYSSFDMNLQTITAQYRNLALKLHPDRNRDTIYAQLSEELMKFVNTAYETLSDWDQANKYNSTLRTNFPTKENYQSNSSTKTNTNNYFPPQRTNEIIYDRDILSHEQIDSMNEHIRVNGNVYGSIANIMGNISVYGSVFGNITNLNGNIIILTVERGACVTNINGTNFIYGDVHGRVRNESGVNKVAGLVDGKITRELSTNSNSFFSSERANPYIPSTTTSFSI